MVRFRGRWGRGVVFEGGSHSCRCSQPWRPCLSSAERTSHPLHSLHRWVFKTIFDKGLVYKSFRVMPYSTACNTPLSNFEAGLNYKDDTIVRR